ncbi:MAG: hypothetical protein SFY80_02265 [Verrucomicrobiota bacterium]|nr:hypothetical protein [Verrucomicrobiota bacterium]
MLPRDFDRIARASFSHVLAPHGFSCEASARCTFYRKVSEEAWHFIFPDMRFHKPVYEVRVFFSSPAIDPEFSQKFPDDLGIPLDTHSVLRIKHGVSHTPSVFSCATKQAFMTAFEKAVESALLMEAIPFLDRIRSVSDMLPYIRHPYFAENARVYLGAGSKQ